MSKKETFLKLYVVVSGKEFPRSAGSYRYKHIRAYESEKRAETYARKLREATDYHKDENARVVEFVPKTPLEEYVAKWMQEQDIQSLNDFYEVFQSDNFPEHIEELVENILGAVLNET